MEVVKFNKISEPTSLQASTKWLMVNKKVRNKSCEEKGNQGKKIILKNKLGPSNDEIKESKNPDNE